MEPSWFLVLEPKKLISENKFCSNMTPSLRTGPPSHYIVIEWGKLLQNSIWMTLGQCVCTAFWMLFSGILKYSPKYCIWRIGLHIWISKTRWFFFVVHSINWRLRSDRISAFGIYVVAPLCHIWYNVKYSYLKFSIFIFIST